MYNCIRDTIFTTLNRCRYHMYCICNSYVCMDTVDRDNIETGANISDQMFFFCF